jgi:thermitase
MKNLRLILIILFFFPSIVFSQEEIIKQGTWRGQTIEYIARDICVKVKRNGLMTQTQETFTRFGVTLSLDFDQSRWGLVRVPAGKDIFPLIDSLLQSPLIETAEPNGVIYLTSIPNDSLFSMQWNMHNTGQVPGGTIDADIDATEAWDITRGDTSVLIAVLDSGIPLISGTNTLSHPDLSNASRIMLGPDIIYHVVNDTSIERDPTIRDEKGHGTHVAGIIGAETNNTTGVAGVCSGCKMLIIQVFSAGVVPHFSNAMAFQRGVDSAIQREAKVINFSGKTDTWYQIVEDAVKNAYEHNVCLVISAGNSSGFDEISNVKWPARFSDTGTYAGFSNGYANVLSVGATDASDYRSIYSDGGRYLRVSAPGGYGVGEIVNGMVFSTFPNYPSIYNPSGVGYGYLSGTSMAAPHVAGVAGLMLSVNPSLTPSQIRQKLQETADKVGGYNYNWDPSRPGHSKELGYGRINAYHALQEAFLQCGPPQNLVAESVKVNTSPTPFRIKLKWRTHPCATSYKVYRKGWGTYEFVNIATVSQPDTTYIDMDVPWAPSIGEENPIHYYVTASYSSLESDSSNNVSANCAFCLEPPKSHLSIEKEKPASYALLPNYPNPFNPTTSIKYELPKTAKVTLKIYDVLGREVRTLVNEEQKAGYHHVVWDSRNDNGMTVSTGIYTYRFIAGEYTKTQKMILLK